MSLKYQPKGALSADLATAMIKLCKVAQDRGLMCNITVTDGRHAETWMSLDPAWSACKMSRMPGGDIHIRTRSKREDYKSRAEQKAHLERTINGLALLMSGISQNQKGLQNLLDEIRKIISFEHYGEEYKGHTAEPPDPDKVPASLKEAADLIFATLDDESLGWVINTSLLEAMPQLHHGFGRALRNSWSLWQDGPLRRHVREKYGLFGHADDLTALIFTWLWAEVQKRDPEADVQAEVEGLKQHWRQNGVNPETGEKGLITE